METSKTENSKEILELVQEINEGKKSGEENGWLSEEDVLAHFQLKTNKK